MDAKTSALLELLQRNAEFELVLRDLKYELIEVISGNLRWHEIQAYVQRIDELLPEGSENNRTQRGVRCEQQ